MKYAKFTRPLTIAFEQHIYTQIKEIGEKRRISMADVIREMAEKALNAARADNSENNSIFN